MIKKKKFKNMNINKSFAFFFIKLTNQTILIRLKTFCESNSLQKIYFCKILGHSSAHNSVSTCL